VPRSRGARQVRAKLGAASDRARGACLMAVPLCGAKARHGGSCRHSAGWGTDHPGFGNCKFHFGATPNGGVFAAKQAAAAEAARLGVAIETDPHEALAAVVNIIAGQVAFLQGKVNELDEGKALTRGGLNPVIRALNGVLEQWQRAAKAAADAGVEERRLRLDALVVDGIGDFLRAVFGELELTPEQEALIPEAMKRHGALLDAFGERPRELTG
jgi:hypothetical protein